MARRRRRRRLLLLLKPFDVYLVCQSGITNPQLRHVDNRRNVHKEAVNFCQNILHHKPVEWKAILRNDLKQPIRDVDLVITVGGDGTLLHASHYLDDSVPVLGVNSDLPNPKRWKGTSMSLKTYTCVGYFLSHDKTQQWKIINA